MLSTLPKLADRRFVLGFFLPSMLLATALRWLWAGDGIWLDLYAKEPTTSVLWIVGVWVFAVVLLGFNDILYRIYAGQRWPLSALTDCKTENRLHAETVAQRTAELHRTWIDRDLTTDERSEYFKLRREVFQSLPTPPARALPTRFGNAMRASFDYPNAVYGVDAVAVWPRLTAVIPKNFADQLDDARCQVDFFLNLSFLSVVACLASVATFCANLQVRWFNDATGWNLFIDNLTLLPVAVAGAAIVLAMLAYGWSIGPLMAWGELVRSAFDLYLPALAAALGFELPPTRAARLQFWQLFSSTAIYGADPGNNVDFDPTVWLRTRPPRNK